MSSKLPFPFQVGCMLIWGLHTLHWTAVGQTKLKPQPQSPQKAEIDFLRGDTPKLPESIARPLREAGLDINAESLARNLTDMFGIDLRKLQSADAKRIVAAYKRFNAEFSSRDAADSFTDLVEALDPKVNRSNEKGRAEAKESLEEAKVQFYSMTQFALAAFGHGTEFTGSMNEKTTKAIRHYQQQRKLAGDGILTTETLFKLGDDYMTWLNGRSVALPDRFIYFDEWADGYASATGTWYSESVKFTWPVQTSKIVCRKAEGLCREFTAILNQNGGTNHLMLDDTVYNIDRWDEKEILAVGETRGCTRYMVKLTRRPEHVSSLRSLIAENEVCNAMEKEIYSTLESGDRVSRKYREKWEEVRTLILLPEKMLKNQP